MPHIIGSYFIAGTSLILFVDWLVNRYTLPQYYTTMALFGIVTIIPSVLILAYFHGAPGKDEWNRLEKVGIPINVIFIAIVILLGNKYDWWFGNVAMEPIVKEKQLLIAEITSDEKNVYFIKKMINIYEGKNDPQIHFLTKDDKNNIYDELITYLKVNIMRDEIKLYTKYNLEEESNKRGEKSKKHTFKYTNRQIEDGIDGWRENHLDRMKDENSMYNVLKNTSSYFGYFSLIYKSAGSLGMQEYNEDSYVLFHTLTTEVVKIKGSDSTYTFHNPNNYKVINKNELIKYMGDYIINTIRSFLLINNGLIIEIMDNGQILFKYDKNKNLLQNRLILQTHREYKYEAKKDDFNDFVNSRVDDLLKYEFYVGKDTSSTFYHDYHTGAGPKRHGGFIGLSTFTKNELKMLLDGTHIFFKDENDPTVTSTYPIATNIRIKILEVYDSTATAVIYDKLDPNIKLKVGDIVRY